MTEDGSMGHAMQNNLRMMWFATLLLSFGCNSHSTTVAVQGEVTYNGLAVEQGTIDFVPVDGTSGPSAVAPIKDGRYALDPKWGLRPDGAYQVRVTALRKTGRKEPNRIDRKGPPVDVTENFIPAIYNTQSSLKVRVAELPDRNKVDFRLGKTSPR
jgi:hypothetical protein